MGKILSIRERVTTREQVDRNTHHQRETRRKTYARPDPRGAACFRDEAGTTAIDGIEPMLATDFVLR